MTSGLIWDSESELWHWLLGRATHAFFLPPVTAVEQYILVVYVSTIYVIRLLGAVNCHFLMLLLCLLQAANNGRESPFAIVNAKEMCSSGLLWAR